MNQTKQQPSYSEQSVEIQPEPTKKPKTILWIILAAMAAIVLISWVAWTYQKTINEAEKLTLEQSVLKLKKQVQQDETVDWQTYKNEEYGFEFKYPGEWVLNEIENGISVKYSKDWQFGMKQGFSPFSVIITNKSLEGFIKSYEDDFLDGVPLTRIISQEGYILDRQSGTKLIGNNAAGINTYYIFVIYNQKKYLISFNENEEVQRTMLSSFHFLK